MCLMSFWAVNRVNSEGAEALEMALHTLRMMALGGIHDHVAQVCVKNNCVIKTCVDYISSSLLITQPN